MIQIEINGVPIKARDGAMVIEAADEAGVAIPRFCYHKKLSIAANCRMCLVEIDKAVKPLPACAIPITEGMKIFTNSPKALMAQKGVMEFLLINHPLDCPICDQGGECELQDVAMGYGRDLSRYQEKKRVIKDKDIGPLISTDMTRCIHCTRCVRFGQEVAGLMELGVTGRGEHLEIGTYIEKSMISEMSGNVIDLCPVGALTAKPSRYSVRPWEMSQHESIAPHDSIGSHLYLHIRDKNVMRVVPRDNETINEVWLSDRDRYSYEGLSSSDRLQFPMIRKEGVWQEVGWQEALDITVLGLRNTLTQHGAGEIGALLAPSSTLEEIYLLQRLLRWIGCNNIDHRLRQMDFSDQDNCPPSPSLNHSIEELERLDATLLIGSNVRTEQPIAAHRLRKGAMRGSRVMCVNPVDYEFYFKVTEKIIVSPIDMVQALAGIIKALLLLDANHSVQGLDSLLAETECNDVHHRIAGHLKKAHKAAVLLGNLAITHHQLATLRSLAKLIAEISGAKVGYLPEAANSTGAWLAGALPHRTVAATVSEPGLNAHSMFDKGLKAYVLMGLEPELDCANPARAMKSLRAADFVVSLSAFHTPLMDTYAHVILPVATFAETSGTYVNLENRWQSFTGAVPPPGEARPGWKVLRVLGNLLDVPNFEYLTSEEVRDEVSSLLKKTSLTKLPHTQSPVSLISTSAALTRIADVPCYAIDPIVRRAASLQQTADAHPAAIYLNQHEAKQSGLSAGGRAVARQGDDQAILPIIIDDRIPNGCALIPAALPETASLGASFGPVELASI
jgi:NADH-quinone oxidoreductase subunit G